MKLHKQLFIGDDEYQIESDDVFHNLFSPSKAFIKIVSNSKQSGIVKLFAGYNRQQMQPVFIGYIENCETCGDKLQLLFCRELIAALNQRFAISLPHPTLQDVTNNISSKTGLQFLLPQKPYTQKLGRNINNVGSALYLLQSLGAVFDIDGYITIQLRTGEIWIGAWQDSPVFDSGADISQKLITSSGVVNKQEINYIPKLRCGMRINGLVVIAIRSRANNMQITLHKNPFAFKRGLSWT